MTRPKAQEWLLKSRRWSKVTFVRTVFGELSCADCNEQKREESVAEIPNASTITILLQVGEHFAHMGDEWRVQAYRKDVATLRTPYQSLDQRTSISVTANRRTTRRQDRGDSFHESSSQTGQCASRARRSDSADVHAGLWCWVCSG